jgi:hypothetical protein
MDESTKFGLVLLQIGGKMKLQLGTSQIVLAWIFWALLLICWVSEGNGCLANTCIMYCNT